MGTAANLDADATDPDGDTLTFSATGLPAGHLDQRLDRRDQRRRSTTGRHQHAVTIRVSDGTAFAAVNDTLTWTVTPAAPTVYANDTFTRTSSNTWGSARHGRRVHAAGTAADFDVAGGVGTIVAADGRRQPLRDAGRAVGAATSI